MAYPVKRRAKLLAGGGNLPDLIAYPSFIPPPAAPVVTPADWFMPVAPPPPKGPELNPDAFKGVKGYSQAVNEWQNQVQRLYSEIASADNFDLKSPDLRQKIAAVRELTSEAVKNQLANQYEVGVANRKRVEEKGAMKDPYVQNGSLLVFDRERLRQNPQAAPVPINVRDYNEAVKKDPTRFQHLTNEDLWNWQENRAGFGNEFYPLSGSVYNEEDVRKEINDRFNNTGSVSGGGSGEGFGNRRNELSRLLGRDIGGDVPVLESLRTEYKSNRRNLEAAGEYLLDSLSPQSRDALTASLVRLGIDMPLDKYLVKVVIGGEKAKRDEYMERQDRGVSLASGAVPGGSEDANKETMIGFAASNVLPSPIQDTIPFVPVSGPQKSLNRRVVGQANQSDQLLPNAGKPTFMPNAPIVINGVEHPALNYSILGPGPGGVIQLSEHTTDGSGQVVEAVRGAYVDVSIALTDEQMNAVETLDDFGRRVPARETSYWGIWGGITDDGQKLIGPKGFTKQKVTNPQTGEAEEMWVTTAMLPYNYQQSRMTSAPSSNVNEAKTGIYDQNTRSFQDASNQIFRQEQQMSNKDYTKPR